MSQDVKVLFEKYFDEWLSYIDKPEFAFHSNLKFFVKNEPYEKIISLGKSSLPYVFEKISNGHFLLNYAASKITGLTPKDILPDKKVFSEQEVSKYWIKWWNKYKHDPNFNPLHIN